jgi:hypothetical protein
VHLSTLDNVHRGQAFQLISNPPRINSSLWVTTVAGDNHYRLLSVRFQHPLGNSTTSEVFDGRQRGPLSTVKRLSKACAQFITAANSLQQCHDRTAFPRNIPRNLILQCRIAYTM